MDYSTLRSEISSDIAKDKQLNNEIQKLYKKLVNNTATYADVTEFSKHLGRVTSKTLVKYGIPEEDFGTWAEQIVAPLFRQMQKTSIEASSMVQKLMNETHGLGISPAKVPTDESRITHLVRRFKEASDVKDVSFLVGSDVAENIARGAVTDSIRRNAEQAKEMGIKSYVVREGNGCCAWCDSMTGIYAIGAEPKDFWRVHKDCTCSFEYKYEKTHTRIDFATDKGIRTKLTTDLMK